MTHTIYKALLRYDAANAVKASNLQSFSFNSKQFANLNVLWAKRGVILLGINYI